MISLGRRTIRVTLLSTVITSIITLLYNLPSKLNGITSATTSVKEDITLEDSVRGMGLKDVQEDVLALKVLCWVPVSPKNLNSSGRVVRATWGKRCDKLVFMTSSEDPSLGAIDLGIQETYNNLWLKTRAALVYIYKNYLDDFEWFMKADDDTYVVVENLKYVLRPQDLSKPSILGCRFHTGYFKEGYMSGGAGYAMNRAAIKAFVEEALPDRTKCPLKWKKYEFPCEDVALARCLSGIGVTFLDTRDERGRGRFFQHPLRTALMDPKALQTRPYYKITTGLNCCSNTAVSFHNLSGSDLFLLDYLLYELRPYGPVRDVEYPAKPPPDSEPIRYIDGGKTEAHETKVLTGIIRK